MEWFPVLLRLSYNLFIKRNPLYDNGNLRFHLHFTHRVSLYFIRLSEETTIVLKIQVFWGMML
jgi:hypothetical protein